MDCSQVLFIFVAPFLSSPNLMSGSNTERPENELVIFTRYPQPGTTKTRLIPAIGAERAAELQRKMTEHTVSRMANVDSRRIQVTVSFTGAEKSEMRNWLGSNDVSFRKQSTGNLGERLAAAFTRSFSTGRNRVIAIGTDCPQLDRRIIYKSFTHLRDRDLLLGPSTDGGYYLIGLSRQEQSIFSDVNWGGSRVYEQTLAAARLANLSWRTLQPLTDVDRPSDLTLLEDTPINPTKDKNE